MRECDGTVEFLQNPEARSGPHLLLVCFDSSLVSRFTLFDSVTFNCVFDFCDLINVRRKCLPVTYRFSVSSIYASILLFLLHD